LKIIQITPAYKPAYIYGGPTMSVAKLCEALVQYSLSSFVHRLSLNDQRLLNLELLTTTANGRAELNVEPGKQVIVDGVPVTYFKRLTKDHTHFSPALLFGLRRAIKEQRTNPPTGRAGSKDSNTEYQTSNEKRKTKNDLIIHIHSWWNLVTIFSCLVAKLYRIPVVLSPRGMLTNYTQNNRNSFFKSTLHAIIGKSLLKYCHILASSEQEKQDVLEIVTPRSIHILPNLVNLSFTVDRLSSVVHRSPLNEKRTTKDEKAFNLLFLSRIEEKKGLDILFDSLAKLHIPWKLSIAGKGEYNYIESLKAKAQNLKIDTHINWLGQVDNAAKFDLMANHDLLVLTSYNENFANVVIESLSVGTPVLLSKPVGLSSYVLTNDLGFVTNLNEDQIADTINEAFLNISKRNQIRDKGPEIIKDDFDEMKLAKQYFDLYDNILSLN
jgi:glycosyltransferase involved in cell wall biosynthesis